MINFYGRCFVNQNTGAGQSALVLKALNNALHFDLVARLNMSMAYIGIKHGNERLPR